MPTQGAAAQLKMRLYLEGLLVDSGLLEAYVSDNEGAPATAQLQLTPTKTLKHILPGTWVHLFVTDPWEPSPMGDLSDFKLLFEGVVIGKGFTKEGQGRAFVLQCAGPEIFWSETRQYWLNLASSGGGLVEQVAYQTSLGAGRFGAVTSTGAYGYMVSRIGQIQEDQQERFFDTLLAVIDDVGNVNPYYTNNRNRFRITDRILRAHCGKVEKLFQLALLSDFLTGLSNRVSGQTNLAELVNLLLEPILHGWVSVTAPPYVEARIFSRDAFGNIVRKSNTTKVAGQTATLFQYEMARDKILASAIFKPDVYTLSPPTCNVLFPNMYQHLGFQENLLVGDAVGDDGGRGRRARVLGAIGRARGRELRRELLHELGMFELVATVERRMESVKFDARRPFVRAELIERLRNLGRKKPLDHRRRHGNELRPCVIERACLGHREALDRGGLLTSDVRERLDGNVQGIGLGLFHAGHSLRGWAAARRSKRSRASMSSRVRASAFVFGLRARSGCTWRTRWRNAALIFLRSASTSTPRRRAARASSSAAAAGDRGGRRGGGGDRRGGGVRDASAELVLAPAELELGAAALELTAAAVSLARLRAREYSQAPPPAMPSSATISISLLPSRGAAPSLSRQSSSSSRQSSPSPPSTGCAFCFGFAVRGVRAFPVTRSSSAALPSSRI